jgi:hypothetical protein
MGTLRYGEDSYAVADKDLVGLQLATVSAFQKRQGFFVELQSLQSTVALSFSPGVPITFRVDTSDPIHSGADVVAGWVRQAEKGGTVEIPT